MTTLAKLLSLTILCLYLPFNVSAQVPPTPTIIDVKEDDRAAVIYWNSKTAQYHLDYDPDKQQGVYSYLVEWGTVASGFTNKEVTPYRTFQPQPLTPNVLYQARVFALNSNGEKSAASNVMQFQHSDVKVNDMRNRLNGFFDDFNLPMGGFDETKWNQAYSGCMKPGWVSQHINNQFHAHNVMASDRCDRGVASSRPRQLFDFKNRTGVIEFDMDGAKLNRQRWYLDFTAAGVKNDITGHIAIDDGSNPPVGDPGYMLRLTEAGTSVIVQLADQYGALHSLQNIYRNGACGGDLRWCSEILIPVPNVRNHWRIELSKTDVRIFVEGILVVDASLQTSYTPNGLPFEEAQLNWIFFSYNTPKENIPLSMIHWDNFGFDAPAGWTDNTVVHNYTDGKLGTDLVSTENDPAAGAIAYLNAPVIAQVPIPDQIRDNANNWPIQTELMFTLQGGNYVWTPNDYITVNGHSYSFSKPTSDIPGFPDDMLIGALHPYSAIVNIDPSHLNTGNNEVRFYLNHVKLLNIHIELLFPKNQAPLFTQPGGIFSGYMQQLMEFTNHYHFGPGLMLREIDGYQIWTSEFQEVKNGNDPLEKLIKQTPVSGVIDIDIVTNSNAQLTASAHAAGIEYFEVLIDSQVIDRVYVNADEPVAASRHIYQLNTGCLSNGAHDLFVIAYDVNGRGSAFDLFESSINSGQYLPVEINVANSTTQPQLDVQLLLEGAYTGSPVMSSELNSKQLLPNQQPFNRMPWNYTGTEQVSAFKSGIVDWVLVSLRTGTDRSTEVARFAALLREDGQLVDVGGCPPELTVGTGTPLFITVYHQSHLNVLSPTAIAFVNNQLRYDFREANSYVSGSGQKELAPGLWGMFAGNGDQETVLHSKDINGEDNTKWNPNNGLFNIYSNWDYNLDGDINGMDRIFWSYNNGVFTSVE